MRLLLDSSVMTSCLEQTPKDKYIKLLQELQEAGHEVFIPANPPPDLVKIATRDRELGGFGQTTEQLAETYGLLKIFAKPLEYTPEMVEQWQEERDLPDDIHTFAFAKSHGINSIITERLEQHEYRDLASVSPAQLFEGAEPAKAIYREAFRNVIELPASAFVLNTLQKDLERVRQAEKGLEPEFDA